MKAIILSGAAGPGDGVSAVQNVLADELSRAGGVTEPFVLRDLNIHHCLGCFDCWVRTPGICAIDDDAREIARSYLQSDLAVLLCPVSFGCYSAELKRGLDRLLCLILPCFTKINGETHHPARYRQYPRLLGLGVMARPDEESARIFQTLVGRNAINFHAPAWAAAAIPTGQPDDFIRPEVRKLLGSVGVRP